jgi:hypothetical protein
MVVPVLTTSRQKIGQGMTTDGRQFSVWELGFNTTIPGLGNKGIAVDLGGNTDNAQQTIGFANVDDARDFISSMETKEYTVYDAMGNAVKERRAGLGTPQGMVQWVEGKETVYPAPAIGAIVPPNAAQYPQAAAALNAPPDAADLPQGSMTGENQQAGFTVDSRPESQPVNNPVGSGETTNLSEMGTTRNTDPSNSEVQNSGQKNAKDTKK